MLRVIASLSVAMMMWGAASAVELTRNHLTASQWVRPADAGKLVGQVIRPTRDGGASVVSGASVALTDANGKTHRATADESGRFVIDGVDSGVYAVTARATEVFACTALHVVDGTDAKSERYPSECELSVATVDASTVKMALIRYLPAAADQSRPSIAGADLEKLAPMVVGDSFGRVAQIEGGMEGKIHAAGAEGSNLADASTTNVFVFRNGTEVARTVTDALGEFRIDRLPAGEYSLLAIGPHGVALTGFELIDEDAITKTASTATSTGYTFVNRLGNACCCCPQYVIQCAPMPEVVTCVEEVIVEEPILEEVILSEEVISSEPILGEEVIYDEFASPFGGGAYGGGGGFYGGGGGGFGGGGLGGLAAVAGIGGVLAAVLSDDDDNEFVPPPVPVSPASP